MSRIRTPFARLGFGSLALAVALVASGCGGGRDHSGNDTTGPKQVAAPQPEATIAQKLCPDMGNPIDTNLFVEHEGRKVYFCCKGCVAPFKADPAKYLAKLDGQPGMGSAKGAMTERGGSDHK